LRRSIESTEIVGVVERVGHISAVRSNPAADADLVQSGLVAIREVQAWCDAQHAGLVARLRDIDSFPEQRIATASKKSLNHAAKSTERSTTLGQTPKLAEALDDGAITADHVDAVTRASKQLDGPKQAELIERANALADVARAGTVEEFARRLDVERKRLQDDDGMDRLARQRRNVRARSWVDAEGMWNLAAKFDPVTGVRVAARIDAMMQATFAETVPDECPSTRSRNSATSPPTPPPASSSTKPSTTAWTPPQTGPPTTPDHPDLTRPPRPRPAKPEFIAVIDADAPGHTGPVAEFSIGVEIPARVLATLAGTADTHAVVVRNGIVLYAPGELNLGRTTRLANRAQRRALRGLYKHCAIPGCTVAYDRCKLHHIIWWRNQGRTDLDNLLPVCSIHHANIHHDDWHIQLGPNRELTLRLPDGSIHTTGPPNRRTAA
jgi:hypothetical protein